MTSETRRRPAEIRLRRWRPETGSVPLTASSLPSPRRGTCPRRGSTANGRTATLSATTIPSTTPAGAPPSWTGRPSCTPPRSRGDDDDDAAAASAVAPTVLDIGCGFGGLTVALATILPEETILGMEIRAKVTEYVRLRLLPLRREHACDGNGGGSGAYNNASVLRTNSMKFLPIYLRRSSVRKMFFCFPDPHFKRKNHPRRIVSERLLSEYAYLLVPGGKLYTITDVKELHEWHVARCDAHPLFERTSHEEDDTDPCVQAMVNDTEEGKKVARNGGDKYYAVYRRLLQSGPAAGGTGWHHGNFFQPVEAEEEEQPPQHPSEAEPC